MWTCSPCAFFAFAVPVGSEGRGADVVRPAILQENVSGLRGVLLHATISAARCVTTILDAAMQALQQPGYRLVGIYAARRSGGSCRGRPRRAFHCWPHGAAGHPWPAALLCACVSRRISCCHAYVKETAPLALTGRREWGGAFRDGSWLLQPGAALAGPLQLPSLGAPPFPSSSAPAGPVCTGCMGTLERAAVRWCSLLISSALVGMLMGSQALGENCYFLRP